MLQLFSLGEHSCSPSGEHKEFENNITAEISKYKFNDGDHVKMRAALKETNWDQVLGDVQDIEIANENFTKALIDVAKKTNIPLYRQERTLALGGSVVKLKSNRIAFETQTQKQFIRTTDKQLKEEKVVDLNREIKSLYQEKR